EIYKAIAEIERLRNVPRLHLMINQIPPNTEVPIHRDFLKSIGQQAYRRWPVVERWHLPITTNKYCGYWDALHGDVIHMELGYWWGNIPYWQPHEVWIRGETGLFHLVIDLDNPEPVGEYAKNLKTP